MNKHEISEVSDRNSQKNKSKTFDHDLTSLSIFTAITVIFIFLESIYIIIKGFKTGLIKKEVLSTESNLGFDLYIKMKS